MDTLAPNQRSKLMSRIKGKNTSPELIVRRLVYSMGYRYRLHAKDLPGKPDLVFRPQKKVIFVHGCFWHQHKGCKYSHIPKSNLAYWKPKLQRTLNRDKAHNKKLKKEGWDILVLWDCEIKNLKNSKKRIKQFLEH